MENYDTKEQVLGIIRHVLTASGGAFVAQGVVTNDQLTAIVAGIVTMATVIWSLYSKKVK